MATRTQPLRVARTLSRAASEVEIEPKASTKSSVAPKASKKRAKSEDRAGEPSKKKEQHEAAVVKGKKVKNGKEKPIRRSRSAEPAASEHKRKAAKPPAIEEEEEEPPVKKGRGKKVSPSQDLISPSDEIHEAASDKLSNGKASSHKAEPIEQSLENKVKKKSAKTVVAAAAKVPPAKNGKKETNSGTLAEPMDDEDEVPTKSNGKKKKKVPTQTPEPTVEEAKSKPKAKAALKKPIKEDDTSNVEPVMEPVEKKSKAKKERNVKKAAGVSSNEEEHEEELDEVQPAPSSKAEKKLLNAVATDYSSIDFGIKEKFNFKITTWNVAGLRALFTKNPDYFSQENADIVCMNELKVAGPEEVPEGFKLKGYHAYWNVGKGFPGVALLSKVKPIQVTNDIPDSDFDNEKRLITAEFEKFYVISTYVVNAGRGLKTLEKRMEWNDAFDEYVKKLDKKKPIIIAGDMNVSHQEIDLANPKANKKSAGFTPQERDGFSKLLSYGFVDTYRHFNPDTVGAYTYWTYMNNCRTKNVGWRLDYFLVSKRFMSHVVKNVIRSPILGSDHCPIVLFMNL